MCQEIIINMYIVLRKYQVSYHEQCVPNRASEELTAKWGKTEQHQLQSWDTALAL